MLAAGDGPCEAAGVMDIVPSDRQGLPNGEVTCMDLLGHVHIDMAGERLFYLTNMLTHERVRLPPGEYKAISNEETCSLVVVRVDEDLESAIQDAESYLHITAWEHADTKEVFMMDDRLGPSSMRSWWDALARFRSVVVNCSLGSQASFSLPVFAFHRARPGLQRIFWSLSDVYKLLQLRSFGSAAKWVRSLSARWEKLWQVIVPNCGVVQSNYTSTQTLRRLALPWPARCLPTAGLPAYGLVVLCVRWSSCSKTGGGLEHEHSRRSAEALLGALAIAARPNGRAWKLRLYFDAAWQYVWPKPDIDYGWPIVELDVNGSGCVDLKPWSKLAIAAPRDSFCRKVFNLVLRGILDSHEPVDLVVLMSILARAPGAAAEKVLLQMCLRLSIQVELALGEQSQGASLAELGPSTPEGQARGPRPEPGRPGRLADRQLCARRH